MKKVNLARTFKNMREDKKEKGGEFATAIHDDATEEGILVTSDSKEGLVKGLLELQGRISVSELKEILGRDLNYHETVGGIKLRKPHLRSYFVKA